MMFCLASCSKKAPAEIALHLIGRGHDGAAVAGMRFHDLALPFGIEQIGKALRRILGFHQIGVVGDDAEPDAETGELAIRIPVLGRIEFCNVFRHIGRQDAIALPDDKVRGIGRVHDIDGADVTGIFLADALEQPLGAGALDPYGDARILCFEGFGEFLGDRQVGRGVVDHLPFLLRRFDQGRRDRLGRGRGGTRVENAAPARTAPVPDSTARREIPGCFISFPALVGEVR
jgi:hypothetical protein